MRSNKSTTANGKGEKSFMSGVLILSLSTLLVKIIGLAFKIPMLSFLGTEGMGYFNSAYEIYALLCVIATAGLPVALSMLVSAARARGDGIEVSRVYRSAKRLFLVAGLAGSAAMLALARPLSDFIGNPDAYPSVLAIAPALALICMASAIRGYCQGFEQMTPTAVSQLIEALCKLILGILLALFAIRRGYSLPIVAAFAVSGITVGTLLSLVYLFAVSRAKKYRLAGRAERHATHTGAAGRLLSIALPITLGSAVIGLTRIIDMALIMRRLQDTGTSVSESNSIYGAYTTLALPVFSLIPALIAPVSMALVPQLASHIERDDLDGQKRIVEGSLRMTVLLAMPASLGLVSFAHPVLELLFAGQTQAVRVSAPLLSALGASVLFSCLMTTCNAVLQSYRRVYLPVIAMGAGVLVKLVSSYILIGQESVGAMGAPIGSLLCNITVVTLDLYFMSAYSSCRVGVGKLFVRPLIASAASVGLAMWIYTLTASLGNTVALMLAMASALGGYALLSTVTGAVTAEDIELLPFGRGLAEYMKRKRKKENTKNFGG